RSPQASDPQRAVAVHRASLERLGLGLLAVLDDVAILKQDPLGNLAPRRSASEQELQIHAEVLELLALRVAHDREGFGVGLDRETLLIPADRFGLLGQRSAQARERPRSLGQLVGRLVVLVETHGTSFVVGMAPGANALN